MQINKDQSIEFTEKRSFSFDGSFTRVFWDIPLIDNQRIDEISISDSSGIIYEQIPNIDSNRPAGYFASRRQGNDYHIEAYHVSANETKTFILSYRLIGALKKYKDVGELYWKVIGDRWDAKTESVVIHVHTPSAINLKQFFVYGHGPLNGQARIIDSDTAEFKVENLRQKQYVEIRVLFPTQLIEGKEIPKIALESIQKEEQGFQNRTKFLQQGRFILFILLFSISFIWIIYWVRLFIKHGKEYKTNSIPKYLQMPPSDLHPALVEALVSQNRFVTTNSFSATILDLARKKKLEVQAIGKYSDGVLGIGKGTKYTYTLILKDLSYDTDLKLETFEKDVIRFIFNENHKVEMEELKKRMKSSPSATRIFFNSWTESVKKFADSKVFIEKESKKWIIKFIISNIIFWLIITFGFALVIGVLEIFFAAIVAILAGIILPIIGIGTFFRRWTKDAGIEAAKWQAFRNYINNLSEIKNNLPQAVIIWQEILIYGTALGVSKKVAEYLPLILSQKGSNINPTWYHVYSVSGGNMNASVAGIGSSMGQDFSNSFSSMVSSFNTSISSGSGGSFSSGGGGGGAD